MDAVEHHALRKSRSTCKLALLSVSLLLVFVRILVRCPAHVNPPDTSVVAGSSGWEGRLQGSLAEHGYAQVVSLLNRSEVESLRTIANTYCYGNPRRALQLAYGGYSVPGFLDIPEFASTHWLPKDPRVHKVLQAVFNGTDYRFASHNDIGCDFVGVWHKDVLRGDVAQFQECDIWSPDVAGERHDIYKVLFYLQDHDHDEQAIKVIPGSHLLRWTPWDTGYVAAHPRMGDAMIIDQRISHAGNAYYNALGSGRLFIQVGFGRKNRFTDEFERGTIARQQALQERMLKATPRQAGFSTFLADVKMTVLGAAFTLLPPRVLNYFADKKAVERHLTLHCSGSPRSSEQMRSEL